MQSAQQNLLKNILAFLALFVFAWFLWGVNFQTLKYYTTFEDIQQVYWNASYFANRVNAGMNPFVNSVFLFPDQTSLVMHMYTILFGLVNFFVNDPILAINITLFGNILFTAFGFYLLAGFWLKNNLFKISVAFLSVFNGYFLAKLGLHLNLVLIGLVPFTVFFFLQSLDTEKPNIKNIRKFLLAIAFFVLNFIFDYYAVFYILVFLGIYYTYQWVLRKWFADFSAKKGLILGVLLIGLHLVSRTLFLHGFDHKGGIWESADIQSMVIPNALGYYFHSNIQLDNTPATENFVFLGYTLVALLCISVVLFLANRKTLKNVNPLLFSLLLLLAVTFPDAKCGKTHLFFMPTSFLHYIPFLDNIRSPSRFIELVLVVSALFCFQVFEGVLSSKKVGKIAAGIVSFIFVVGVYFDHATQAPKEVSKNALAVNEMDKKTLANKIVLSFPFGIRDGLRGFGEFNLEDYKLALIPGIKLLSGYFSRIPQSTWDRVQNDSLLQILIQFENTKINGEFNFRNALFDNNFLKWVVAHKIDVIRIDHKKYTHETNSMMIFKKLYQMDLLEKKYDSANQVDYYFPKRTP